MESRSRHDPYGAAIMTIILILLALIAWLAIGVGVVRVGNAIGRKCVGSEKWDGNQPANDGDAFYIGMFVILWPLCIALGAVVLLCWGLGKWVGIGEKGHTT